MDDSLLLQGLVSPASRALPFPWAFVPVWHSASVSIPGPFVLRLHCCLLLCSACQRCDPCRTRCLAPCFRAGSCQQNLCSLRWVLRTPLLPCSASMGPEVPQCKRDSCKMYCQNLINLFVSFLRCANWVLLGTHNATKSGQCFHSAEGMLVKVRSSSVKIVSKRAWKFYIWNE